MTLPDSATPTTDSAVTGDDAAVNGDAPTNEAGGCGCRTTNRPTPGWLALALALVGLAVRRRRHM